MEYRNIKTAGQIERSATSNQLWLSPRPTDFGYVARDAKSQVADVNDAVMTLSGTSSIALISAMDRGCKSITMMFSIPFALYTAALVLGIVLGGWSNLFYQYFFVGILFGLACAAIPILALRSNYNIAKREISKQFPILFNRQRREVVFPIRDDAHLEYKTSVKNTKTANYHYNAVYIPWEELKACVEVNTMFNPDGFISLSNLSFYFPIPTKADDEWKIRLPFTADADAMSLWSYIYHYMESGPDAVPEPPRAHANALEYYKERQDYIEQKIIEAKQSGNKQFYKDVKWARRQFFWGMYQLPYRLANRLIRIKPAPLPDEVALWSKPIAESEWASASNLASTERTQQWTTDALTRLHDRS